MTIENKITVNGKQYNDFSEVPDKFKVIFKDENVNGIPDILEGVFEGFPGKDSKNADALFSSISYNGKIYKSKNELPPEARDILEKGLSRLDNSGLKISAGVQNAAAVTSGTGSNDVSGEVPESHRNEVSELSPGFKFRLAMTAIFLLLALVYILWLIKLI
ncbi:MAG: hypothetical protein ACHQIH_04580 [Ignavibacteria bacterium]